MEINLNCDLGEKSKHHSNENDPDLLKIVNSANVACGYHAGDEETMKKVVEISKENNVSIGAHPSFNDPENFGRKRINLTANEISKLVTDQYEILQNIAIKLDEKVSHIKPHGALNNMACEDIELATILAKTIYNIDKDIIYLVPTGSKMEIAAKKLNMKIACEIFADRNYEKNYGLVPRSKSHAIIEDRKMVFQHVRSIYNENKILLQNGEFLEAQANTFCVHSDTPSAVEILQYLQRKLAAENIYIKS